MRSILVIVATLATILFNGLAATGRVNGITPAEISDKYPTLLTPAGYAFTIWSLIYVGMLAFSVYQALPRNAVRYRPVRSLYIFSCLLNCAWIYFWHREQIGICLAIILALCGTLIFIRYRLAQFETIGDNWLAKVPFGIYAGWVTAASTVNLLVLLKSLNVQISSEHILAIALIAIASIAAVALRITIRDYVFPLAVAWAFTAIAIKQGGNTSVVVATAVGVVVCVLTAGSIVVDLKDSTSE